jgi:stearoyl-CoA desaturase (delta-9 desaturase)
MDLWTPARIWAKAETTTAGTPAPRAASGHTDDHDHHAHDHHALMPLGPRIAMFFSVVVPFVGLLAGIVLMWKTDARRWGIGWPEVFAMLAMYALAGFGVTIGYHRHLTHKAFETIRPIRLLLAILGSSAGQGMTIKWIATHRRHHQASDRPGDPHSPHLHGEEGILGMFKGMWHAHLGWAFEQDKDDLARSVPDLLSDRAMMRIDQLYFLWLALGILLPGAALGLWYGTWMGFASGVVWGGLVRIFLMQHVTWSINSVCHVWGTRTYRSADHSVNNFPIAIVSLGEGWHNNHHAFPTSARHGLHWWQFDSSWLIIWTMQKLGLVWDVRLPNEAAMAAKKLAA